MPTKRIILFVSIASLAIGAFLFKNFLIVRPANASQKQPVPTVEQDRVFQEQASAFTKSLPGLRRQVTVVKDKDGAPHITASNDHDVYFMMGYLHAEDRFFQMDVARRIGGGTLAEILGAGPGDQFLGGDMQMRAFGISSSAERSLAAYAPNAIALMQAYSDGVNAWLDRNPLPPEYAELEITQALRWRPVDSVTILKFTSFQLAFDIGDLLRTEALSNFQFAGQANGFDGTRLFFEDIFTVAPFDPTVTVPQPSGAASLPSRQIQSLDLQSRMIEQAGHFSTMISPDVIEGAHKFIEQYKHNPLLNRPELGKGSNMWVVAGSKTDTGNAMLANDPHLSLGIPANFYEIHLTVDTKVSPMNVYGVSFAGVPGVFLGQNERISWGATTSPLDVTDFFAESLVTENGVPVATQYKGGIEPLAMVPFDFKINQIQNGIADDVITVNPGDRPSGLNVPVAIPTVPRRNNGLLVQTGPSSGFSIQYTGNSATRDLEGIFALARARNLTDFKQGLQFLDVGSLNWAYADVDGNIATFVSGKIPLREDLQAGTIDGLPPFFLRDGTGIARNEWIPRSSGGTGFNFESLPFEELPQAVNPAQGFLVNANNDPLGITMDNNPINQTRSQGIYYIAADFNPGFRAAKITSLLNQQFNSNRGHGKVSFGDMRRIQSNVQMLDAEVFIPYIVQAFDRARSAGAPAELAALANDQSVGEAVRRLSNWDFSAPTGISKGYDAGDLYGVRLSPSKNEVSNSIAATIYTVWRSQILANTIIATLQRAGLVGVEPASGRALVDLRILLDNFSTNHGVGASGLDFFEIPGVNAPPEIRRDGVILKSLKDALTLLASEDFADAFSRSTNQNDYRWGKLHRITFRHLFGSLAPQFSIPTAGNFEDLSPTLPGLAVDGGFETIDNGPFNVFDASSSAYRFNVGSARRYVGELRRDGIKSIQVIPGGESGVVFNRFYSNQLPLWLTNEYHCILITKAEINFFSHSKIIYRPVK